MQVVSLCKWSLRQVSLYLHSTKLTGSASVTISNQFQCLALRHTTLSCLVEETQITGSGGSEGLPMSLSDSLSDEDYLSYI